MCENYSAAVARETGRVICARILPDRDVIGTLEEICAKYGIKYGKIDVCIGSLRKINFKYVSTANPGPGEGYTTPASLSGAFNILAGQGLVSPGDEEGKLNTHIHFVISGQMDAVLGGHIDRGTRTLTTTDLFITELAGIRITRGVDPLSGAVTTTFEQAE